MTAFDWDGRLVAFPADRAAAYRASGEWSEQATSARLHDSAVQFAGRTALITAEASYTYRELDERDGTPDSYFFHTQMLVLWPTPATSITAAVDYKLRPAPLVQDTDSPFLSPEWHEVILVGARARALSALMEFSASMAVNNEYVNLIRRKRNEIAEEDTGRVPRSSMVDRASMGVRRGWREDEDRY